MNGQGFGKLIELILIAGAVWWFWSSQMAAVRRKPDRPGASQAVTGASGDDPPAPGA